MVGEFLKRAASSPPDLCYGETIAKRKRGRPATKRLMPDPIPETPENVMHAIVNTPSKRPDEWRYLQDDETFNEHQSR